MNLIRFDLPRSALFIDASIAALAAVGITILVGAEAHAMVGVPIVTAVLTLALLVAASRAGLGPAGIEAIETDGPTRLATEEVADEALDREFGAAQRGRLMTIVLVRIEGLAAYRERHGQATTDRLLRAAGRVFVRHRRRMDLAAHHGVRTGTFLAVLSGADREGADAYVARLRDDLMNLPGLPPHDGVSFGIAPFEPSMRSPADLVRAATEALDPQSEPRGRVRVVARRVAQRP